MCFSYLGCGTRLSTATTTVLSILLDTTFPTISFLGILMIRSLEFFAYRWRSLTRPFVPGRSGAGPGACEPDAVWPYSRACGRQVESAARLFRGEHPRCATSIRRPKVLSFP